ncbi:aminopeptidase P1-like isoform X2 [Solanum pennellii]|uniref:Aminopeptidase P1-like isoform X2 n=1 Tax=Solanum pennellii TaxID=28526 RepID=A0ABM1FZ83_SOLPN|nr:aminopeptidase P1-like isoform X2 [Solanum pennellii]
MFSDDFVSLKCLYSFPLIRRLLDHSLVYHKDMQEIYGASGYFMEAESTKQKKQLGTRRLTEVSVSDKLEEFRASKEHFRGLSFPTTSSVGSNAAIIHYKPEAETCAELDPDCIYLFDSGAQYLDGTTDITQTIHFGKPSPHENLVTRRFLKDIYLWETPGFLTEPMGKLLTFLLEFLCGKMVLTIGMVLDTGSGLT